MWAASWGNERTFRTRKVKSGSGIRHVKALASIEAVRGKYGSVRRGWVWLVGPRDTLS